VRTLCQQCRKPYHAKREDLPSDFPFDELRQRGNPIYAHAGCRACRQTGYSGRLGIYELLVTTDRIRQLCHDRVGTWALKQAATEEGMLTLRQDGWIKVLNGRTTVEEVLRVTKGDIVGK
jgi:general secretion pathway protein E/type IV pilus assembly protein PilB